MSSPDSNTIPNTTNNNQNKENGENGVNKIDTTVKSLKDKWDQLDFTKQPSLVNIIIQFFLGIIVTFLIYLIAKIAVQADKLVIDEDKDVGRKRVINITNGYIESAQPIKINTVLDFAENYLAIKPSMNVKGGSQFTYQFWLFIDDPTVIGDKTLFIKGDYNQYRYKVTENKYNIKIKTMEPYNTREILGQISKAPMLTFKSGGDPDSIEFNMKFNTLHNINETFEVTNIKSDNNIYRNNLLSIFAKQWFMVTIIFQDNMQINDFENGIVVRFYINDILYKQQVYNSALKLNDGDLILFPDVIPGCKMSAINYYNYAINEALIVDFYKKGPILTPSSTIGGAKKSMVSYISDMNKLDIYNA